MENAFPHRIFCRSSSEKPENEANPFCTIGSRAAGANGSVPDAALATFYIRRKQVLTVRSSEYFIWASQLLQSRKLRSSENDCRIVIVSFHLVDGLLVIVATRTGQSRLYCQTIGEKGKSAASMRKDESDVGEPFPGLRE